MGGLGPGLPSLPPIAFSIAGIWVFISRLERQGTPYIYSNSALFSGEFAVTYKNLHIKVEKY